MDVSVDEGGRIDGEFAQDEDGGETTSFVVHPFERVLDLDIDEVGRKSGGADGETTERARSRDHDLRVVVREHVTKIVMETVGVALRLQVDQAI